MKMVGLILFAILLPGCTSPSEAPAAHREVPAQPPQNRTGEMIAYAEAPIANGSSAHRHDAWAGRERVFLFHGQQDVPDAPATVEVIPLRLPQGSTVYEGTDRIEVVSFAPQRHACQPSPFSINHQHLCGPAAPDPGPAPHLTLHARSPTGEWREVGPIVWNQTLVIPIREPRETDMPHATQSLWEFQLTGATEQERGLTWTTEVTAVRGPGEIAPWPGHPAFYLHGHDRLVLSAHAITRNNASPILGEPIRGMVTPTALVSSGTRSLVIRLNLTELSVDNPAVKFHSLFLMAHNASGEWVTVASDPSEHLVNQTAQRWIAAVDPNGMDSPYAGASRWEFMVRAAAEPSPVDNLRVPCECSGYTLKYDLLVVARDLPAFGPDLATI